MKKAVLFLSLGIVSIFSIETIQAYAADTIKAALVGYLTPFNVPEIHYTDITPFYKWTGVLARMDARPKPLQIWLDNRKTLEGLPPREMVQKVDDIINNYDYVADLTNWGVSNYWETPAEFFAHGGSCKDFAIAKYAWLRYLGVPEERLRIAVVYDRIKDLPHAVVILYINNKPVILDSQVREIRDSTATSRYRMLYSINRLGWWHPLTTEGDRVSMLMGTKGRPAAILFPKECLAGAPLPGCLNAIEPAPGNFSGR